jgi:hypothetical protein
MASTDDGIAFCKADGDAIGAAPAGATNQDPVTAIDAATKSPNDLFMTKTPDTDWATKSRPSGCDPLHIFNA